MTPLPAERLENVKLLLLDVDGVLTDGRIIYSSNGDELKSFHVRDGSALKFWQESGGRVAIVSGRTSPAVDRRAKELGINLLFQGCGEKLPSFRRILSVTGFRPDQVCAIGDDLLDLPVLKNCGVPVAVADAPAEVKAVAAYVTTAVGGAGAVRETVEWIMNGQATWRGIVERLSAESL